jgi:hypothetical protein
MKYKILFLWLAAIAITLAAIIYQRITGPSNPQRMTIHTDEGSKYSFQLPRSHGGIKDARIEISFPDTSVTGILYYKRYPVNEPWSKTRMKREKASLIAFLPHQPPAGKLEYRLVLVKNGKEIRIPEKTNVIMRFRGDVPAPVIIPHALLMFIAMLLANVAALMALTANSRFRFYTYLTTTVLLVGGMILGPIVQKYAFGQFWTGFPIGFDLTDNKTLIAFIFWIVASLGNLKKGKPWLTIIAAIVTLVVFSIPHSARGSELDYETGRVKTGMVQPASNVLNTPEALKNRAQ